MNSLLEFFGRERFTITDLWRKWIGKSYYPDLEFKKRYERLLTDWPFIDEAPGPRGGRGWRITEAAHAAYEAQQRLVADQNENLRRQNKRAEPHARALSSRFGRVEIDFVVQRVAVVWPDPHLKPRYFGGFGAPFQDLRFSDVLRQWVRRRRFRIVTSGRISIDTQARLICQWRHAKRAAPIFAEADELFRREIEDATEYYQQRLGALTVINVERP